MIAADRLTEATRRLWSPHGSEGWQAQLDGYQIRAAELPEPLGWVMWRRGCQPIHGTDPVAMLADLGVAERQRSS